ncbi:hypothetical protein [Beijerinckia sp. L45]|uniref:hypothetical protein n=1 Tax=Beijerinckia sp. L45 TaxID=1641855 RepID=UPI00131D9D7C|nr:hypothetical protein [Beijerinckia sp. L45]
MTDTTSEAPAAPRVSDDEINRLCDLLEKLHGVGYQFIEGRTSLPNMMTFDLRDARAALKKTRLEAAFWKIAAEGEHKLRCAERETNEATIAELRKALEPFAAYIAAVDPNGDFEGEIGGEIVGALRRSISYAACREAARVLAKPGAA